MENKSYMEVLGFLKEYENGPIKVGISIRDIEPIASPLFETYQSETTCYLERAPILLAMTRWISDIDGNSIGPLIIHTDGIWIWPSYLVYYLNKGYQTLISDDFINYMRDLSFIPNELTKERRRNVEEFYIRTFDPPK
ncbi:hypothetical protein [[Flexibacter] sp. ATCC 35208]|uniref:hypothetical protein n=1 Tax=[Flexibacter] sp. ATCC 35208 TaxID=1936242 RepID=UPI00117E5FFD|nr:hypothetical protein [[Flexibacter] sp. ATCC 35208]